MMTATRWAEQITSIRKRINFWENAIYPSVLCPCLDNIRHINRPIKKSLALNQKTEIMKILSTFSLKYLKNYKR